jgi:serine/threonine-protein kinase
MALLWAHQYDPPPPLSEQRPDIPQAADEVLLRALAKVPDDRYDTCLEFVAALRAGASVAGPGGRTPTLVDARVDAIPVTGSRVPEPPGWAGPVFRGLR